MELKTKYNIGDAVFFMHNNKVNNSYVKNIEVKVNPDSNGLYPEPHVSVEYHVTINNARYYECELFSTKEELINSL